MKPQSLKTKIFLDSGDPAETKEALGLLGFLDGQTTNPSLIAKNPQAQERIASGEKFSKDEVIDFYKKVIKEISSLIPQGSISVEVYADAFTPADQMIKEAKNFYSWIPNAHIKLPTNAAGLEAAYLAVKEGIRVNMTLCFSQDQAAAVHAATKIAKRGQVYVSPFVGRLDDQGENGMDLVANIIRMYRKANSHVEVLAASVRSLDHFLYALALGTDIVTVPLKILKEWAKDRAMEVPASSFNYKPQGLRLIPFRELDLTQPWESFGIRHELTEAGLEKFSSDWNQLISG